MKQTRRELHGLPASGMGEEGWPECREVQKHHGGSNCHNWGGRPKGSHGALSQTKRLFASFVPGLSPAIGSLPLSQAKRTQPTPGRVSWTPWQYKSWSKASTHRVWGGAADLLQPQLVRNAKVGPRRADEAPGCPRNEQTGLDDMETWIPGRSFNFDWRQSRRLHQKLHPPTHPGCSAGISSIARVPRPPLIHPPPNLEPLPPFRALLKVKYVPGVRVVWCECECECEVCLSLRCVDDDEGSGKSKAW